MSRTQVRVYVVDDDSQLRASLVRLLEQLGYVVLTFPSGDDFVLAYPELPPGCVILDVVVRDIGGSDLQRRLISIGCRWPVIVLTGHGDEAAARQAMETGAVAFLTEPVRRVELLAALVRANQYLLGAADPIPDPEVLHRMEQLTARERAVLQGVLDGKMNKEMAAQFGITVSAVKSYRSLVMKKLGARTPAELVTLAYRAGFKLKRPS